MTKKGVASKLDNAFIRDGVLVLQYLVVYRTLDGRYQAQHDVKFFEGAKIDVELEKNTEARDFLSMKVEAALEDGDEPIASVPTFELADLKRKGASEHD